MTGSQDSSIEEKPIYESVTKWWNKWWEKVTKSREKVKTMMEQSDQNEGAEVTSRTIWVTAIQLTALLLFLLESQPLFNRKSTSFARKSWFLNAKSGFFNRKMKTLRLKSPPSEAVRRLRRHHRWPEARFRHCGGGTPSPATERGRRRDRHPVFML